MAFIEPIITALFELEDPSTETSALEERDDPEDSASEEDAEDREDKQTYEEVIHFFSAEGASRGEQNDLSTGLGREPLS